MKILYVHCLTHAQSLKGGPRVHIESSTRALRSFGHDVRVLTGGAPRAGITSPAARWKQSGFWRRLVRYGYEPREYLRSVKGLAAELAAARDFAPDVIVARYEALHPSIAVVAWLLGIPLIWEVNSTLSETRRWSKDLYIYPGTERLEALVLKMGKAVVVVSAELKRLLVAEGLSADSIAVVPNGADPDCLMPRPRDEQLCQRFGLTRDHLVVGFFGSFFGWHDVRTIIELVPRLAAENPSLRFLLAGGSLSDLEDDARLRLAGLEDRVILSGTIPVEEAPRYFSLMDVGLSLYPELPDFHFSPIKLFEYMACGIPVVATALGQQASVITEGANGLLAPPGDVESVAAMVQRLLDSEVLRRSLGESARRTIVERYTWRHNARRILDVCEAVAGLDRRQMVAGAVVSAACRERPAARPTIQTE